MRTFVFADQPLTVADVVAASHGPVAVEASVARRAAMQEARDVLDGHLARGIPVYGLNTGLGGNIGHRITAAEADGLQASLVMARVAGVGAALPVDVCRAVLFCRLAGLVQAGAGVSLPVFDLLCAMLARDLVPVIPSRGSTGASDLVQTMSIAAVAIGEGEAYLDGVRLPAREALARAGLVPARLAPKDGLSIGSASSVTVATAALAIVALDDLAAVHVGVAALACEGFGASPYIFDARIASARPAAGQVEAASLFRAALAGGGYFSRSSPKVQDALSFRALPQVTGSFLAALQTARREVEIELNSPADNPLVIGPLGEVRSSANFLTASIALSFDSLAIAVAQLATACVQRSIKLMTGRLSGLPNYLSPVGGASAGFVPMQKSLAALHAEIRLKATPASLDTIVVSEMVEDIGTNSVLAVSKLAVQLEPMRWLIAIEAMLAAQAVDLRRRIEPALSLSPVGVHLHDTVRAAVPALDEDRATGPDAAKVHDALWKPQNVRALRSLAG
ncbi:aromatic amino acid ammonia-lyase [Aquibium sp. ELW1220]|uniref:HAL/PAL/TAL family ammonia-lyase n=1 Tax=Aquibium sp. ELW1220 TaxID=2976766 RepID=UPI0025AFF84F|nr:aromatic amino acid ammonia-lyase [Aquibium sp. ELW1220]MDN2580800.1 aromatic amino acid lyase [Aquibium sp. ELW1220]